MEQVCRHGFIVSTNKNDVYACEQCKNDPIVNTISSTVKAKTNKEDFDLTQIPYSSLLRVAKIFKEGELKYGKGNWLNGKDDKGYQLERANHALKHLLIYIHYLQYGEYLGQCSYKAKPTEWVVDGTKEDDLAKVLWFCCTQIELERLSNG